VTAGAARLAHSLLVPVCALARAESTSDASARALLLFVVLKYLARADEGYKKSGRRER
jgi:hypothetical protein